MARPLMVDTAGSDTENVSFWQKHAHGVLRKTAVTRISGIGYCAWLTGWCTGPGIPLAREAFSAKPVVFSQNQWFLAKNEVISSQKWEFLAKMRLFLAKSGNLWPKMGKFGVFLAKMGKFGVFSGPKQGLFWPKQW